MFKETPAGTAKDFKGLESASLQIKHEILEFVILLIFDHILCILLDSYVWHHVYFASGNV